MLLSLVHLIYFTPTENKQPPFFSIESKHSSIHPSIYPSITYVGNHPSKPNHRLIPLNRPSSVQPIQLNQPRHHPDDLAPPEVQRRVLDLALNQPVNDAAQAGDKDTDARPPAQPQPAVNDEAAALGVELDGAGEEQEGVGVECWR